MLIITFDRFTSKPEIYRLANFIKTKTGIDCACIRCAHGPPLQFFNLAKESEISVSELKAVLTEYQPAKLWIERAWKWWKLRKDRDAQVS